MGPALPIFKSKESFGVMVGPTQLVRERGPEYIRKAKQASKASKHSEQSKQAKQASKQSKQAKQTSNVRERGPKPSKLSKLSKPRRLHYLKSAPGAAKFPPKK